MKSEFLLEVNGFSLREAGKYILRDISFRILPGECWVITGSSGSGKSTLLRSIANYRMFTNHIHFGKIDSQVLKVISHQHKFQNFSGVSDFYYQQRFNSTESDDADTLMNDLLKVKNDPAYAKICLRMLQIEHLADSPMIWLSNGEHKRYQVAKALFEKADWLLLDDPYTGLDVQAREMLNEILSSLIVNGINILVVSGREIPGFITHVATLNGGILTGVHRRESFLRKLKKEESKRKEETAIEYPAAEAGDFKYAVRMNSVSVHYDGRQVLSNINWEVQRGEKWCLSGHNGSGKSTLLSLINADNPQAFANDIHLFDRKRGTGETIWDIKKKIGYISPELHQYFDRTMSCYKAVASGLFDTIGLFRRLHDDQQEKVSYYLELFGINDIAEKPLNALSHGMQRWVLLARALVKNPPLIILDEPCQGLDDVLCKRFIDFIDGYCKDAERTLLYVTHVAEELPKCITRNIKLKEGKIIEISNNEKEHNSNSGRRNRA